MSRFTFSAIQEETAEMRRHLIQHPESLQHYSNGYILEIFPEMSLTAIEAWRRGETTVFNILYQAQQAKGKQMTDPDQPVIVSKRSTAVSSVFKTQIILKGGMYRVIVLSQTEGEIWNIPGETYTQAEAEAHEVIVVKELQKHLTVDIGRAIKQSTYSWYNEED